MNWQKTNDGVCKECKSWTGGGVIAVAVGVGVGLIAVMHVAKYYGGLQIINNILEHVEDLELKSLGKIFLATVQILGGLPKVLNLKLPDAVKRLLNTILGVFQFDISL